jgi:hypothetical protein
VLSDGQSGGVRRLIVELEANAYCVSVDSAAHGSPRPLGIALVCHSGDRPYSSNGNIAPLFLRTPHSELSRLIYHTVKKSYDSNNVSVVWRRRLNRHLAFAEAMAKRAV